MTSAAEERPCSVCLGKGPWRRSVKIGERGSLESSRQRCVGLVGLQGLPLVLDIPWTFGLASFHFSVSLFSQRTNNDHLFHSTSVPLIIICYAQHQCSLQSASLTLRILIRKLVGRSQAGCLKIERFEALDAYFTV